MRAKEYYELILDCKDKNQVESVLENILDGLTKELKTLISARGGMMDSPKYRNIVSACLRETNMKWQYIVTQFAMDIKAGRITEDNPFRDNEFVKDAFKAYFVKLNPEFSFLFDVDKYEKWIETEIERRKKVADEIRNKVPRFYKLTPLDEITKENIVSEILSISAAIGSYASAGLPISCMTGLAFRVTLLRWWNEHGIDYEDIKEFEKDQEAWARSHS